MPELPEARTIARRLHAALVGRTIRQVRLHRADMLKTGTPRALCAALVSQVVARIDTRGKYVVLHTGQARLVMQLGMAGRVRLADGGQAIEPHTHLTLVLDDGRQMHYANVRRIAGGLHLIDGGEADLGPLAALGPEADQITLDQFRAALAGRRRAVKAALLDQSLLAGLGNIYTDEALAAAGIRPARRADRLTGEQLARLHRAIRAVLAEAVAAGGSSLADANPFVDADGRLGYFAVRHRVYGRYGQPCRTCGATLTRTLIAGRTTTFCPRCQR